MATGPARSRRCSHRAGSPLAPPQSPYSTQRASTPRRQAAPQTSGGAPTALSRCAGGARLPWLCTRSLTRRARRPWAQRSQTKPRGNRGSRPRAFPNSSTRRCMRLVEGLQFRVPRRARTKAHKIWYHSTLGSRAITKKKSSGLRNHHPHRQGHASLCACNFLNPERDPNPNPLTLNPRPWTLDPEP